MCPSRSDLVSCPESPSLFTQRKSSERSGLNFVQLNMIINNLNEYLNEDSHVTFFNFTNE